jgi:hypothetical protein
LKGSSRERIAEFHPLVEMFVGSFGLSVIPKQLEGFLQQSFSHSVDINNHAFFKFRPLLLDGLLNADIF